MEVVDEVRSVVKTFYLDFLTQLSTPPRITYDLGELGPPASTSARWWRRLPATSGARRSASPCGSRARSTSPSGGAKSPREASSPASGAGDDKLEAALLQLRDVASDAKLLRGEHVAERQRALATASGVELLPHRFCFSAEPPLANETHTASSRATTATTPLDFEIGARPGA